MVGMEEGVDPHTAVTEAEAEEGDHQVADRDGNTGSQGRLPRVAITEREFQ